MRLPFLGVPLALTLAVLTGGTGPAHAATVRTPSLASLALRAERIVLADVVEVRSVTESYLGDRVPVTLVTVRVERTLKGTAASHLILEFLGGSADGDSLELSDLPRFAVGDRDVLFLQAAGRRVSPLVGTMHGRFRVLPSDTAPRERVVAYNGRPLLEGDGASAATSRWNPDAEREGRRAVKPLSLAAFESRVRDLVARQANGDERGVADDVLDETPVDPAAAWTATRPVAPVSVAVNLGTSPALFDGCPDWLCALRSHEPFRTMTDSASGFVASASTAGTLSLEWGRDLFGRAMDPDALALTVRRTTPAGTASVVVFNGSLAWNSYEGPERRSASRGVLLDLPRVAAREVSTLIASETDADVTQASGTATPISRRRTTAASPSSFPSSARSSRTGSPVDPLDLSAAACDPGGVFVDPRLLVFDSPDHALMTGYQVGFFQPGAGQPIQVVELPLTAFLQRRVIDLPSWAALALQTSLAVDIRSAGLATPIGVVYTYGVRGVWAGGTTAWSERSQPFVRCATTPAASR